MNTIYCPMCKKIHEMNFKREPVMIPLGGQNIEFVKETMTCNELGLSKSTMKIRDEKKMNTARMGFIKEAWNSLNEEDKKLVLADLQRQMELFGKRDD